MLRLHKLFGKSTFQPLSAKVLNEFNATRFAGPMEMPCYAPFKNIYFGHHGKASACCYNRLHTLGQYPKQTVHEIWFGEQADNLRNYIRHNDFSSGCQGCKSALMAGNYDAVKARLYDEQRLNANNYPSVIEFELSNVCNLECEMCSGDFSSLIRVKREKLPPLENAYDDAFVEQLDEFIPHLQEVRFYGGEPFLIEIYYKIWERILAINPQVRISVQTNATVLNSRVKEVLQRANFHINISIDSLEKETYEIIRKNADYDKVIENINYFHQYCKEKNTFFGISVCAMQRNWQQLPAFINYCNGLNAPIYIHTVTYPLSSSMRVMDKEMLGNALKYLRQFDFPATNAVASKNKGHYFDFVKQVEAWYSTSVEIRNIPAANNVEDLKKKILQHVEDDAELSISQKAEKLDRISLRFAEVEKELGPELLLQAFKKIDFKDPSLLDNYVYYLDKLPLSVLTTMAKAALSKPDRN